MFYMLYIEQLHKINHILLKTQKQQLWKVKRKFYLNLKYADVYKAVHSQVLLVIIGNH